MSKFIVGRAQTALQREFLASCKKTKKDKNRPARGLRTCAPQELMGGTLPKQQIFNTQTPPRVFSGAAKRRARGSTRATEAPAKALVEREAAAAATRPQGRGERRIHIPPFKGP